MSLRFLADTTLLLAANEVLRPNTVGAREIESREAFRALVTLVCNQIPLGHLFPGDYYSAEPLPIVKMLNPEEVPVRYHLDEAALADLYNRTADRFLSYAQDANARLKAWLRMQIGDESYERTFFDANEASRRSSIRQAYAILREFPKYDETVAGWRTLGVGDFQFAGRHHDDATGLGTYHYLCAYAYFAFVKGPLFAAQSELPETEFKLDHWLRRDAIRLVFDPATPSPPKAATSHLFDWGSIVLEIFELSKPRGSLTPGMLQELIAAARDAYSPDVLANGSAADVASWVVEALIDGGWRPVLTPAGEPRFVKLFASAAKKLVGHVDHSRVGQIGIDAVALPLDWKLLSRSKARIDAKRYQFGEPFKNVFADEVNSAIVKFVS